MKFFLPSGYVDWILKYCLNRQNSLKENRGLFELYEQKKTQHQLNIYLKLCFTQKNRIFFLVDS